MPELIEAMRRHARQRPHVVAIRDPNRNELSWSELSQQVERTARQLARDHHAYLIHENHNTLANVLVSLGCLASGLCEVSIDGRFPLEVRRSMIERTQEYNWQTNSATTRPALVLWTSGTTDRPRGVMLSSTNLDTNAQAKLNAVPQTNDDHRLTLLPISHAYARTCDMGTWLLSGCQWTIDLGTSALDRIDSRNPPTLINTVPSVAAQIVNRLDRSDPSLAKLRVVGCGGAAITEATFQRLRHHDVEVIQGYGCTETSPVICSAAPGDTIPGLVGRPVDGWEVDVRDGRLFVRGAGSMLGYLNDPEATHQKLASDGWLDTGDLVEVQPDGNFRILGRADDVIVLPNGFKVHPQSIEAKLMQSNSIEFALIFPGNSELIVAIQAKPFSIPNVKAELAAQLPPGTRFRIEPIVPDLSHQNNELTAKGTPRRSEVAKRFAS
ncbi:long-chain acyl-CoA synthetase [Neorhodopirellula lusitana]|uniref:Long-chain acyl-CoA synthetase n=1 Tax=Neorhodopirellula lusitana TaxID=445327 RepID=A0ABY1PQK5_9BACT|nr:AMP-binding protein [Neorhodopirellula lusitana]SMP40900.1 long-chain acyl-CoA synthetase [Neorhodopirellula lusitana]